MANTVNRPYHFQLHKFLTLIQLDQQLFLTLGYVPLNQRQDQRDTLLNLNHQQKRP